MWIARCKHRYDCDCEPPEPDYDEKAELDDADRMARMNYTGDQDP